MKSLAEHLAEVRNQFYKRYSQSFEKADIEKTVSIAETVSCLDSANFNALPISLSNLGNFYLTLYEGFGDYTAVEKAVPVLQEASRMLPPNDKAQITVLNNLCVAYIKSFDHIGNPVASNDAITAAQCAVSLAERLDRSLLASCCFNLASAYERQHEFSGQREPLDKAIEAFQKILDMTDDQHPKMPMYRNGYGHAKELLFKITADINDIEQAIVAYQFAVKSISCEEPNKASFLNNLANALQGRWEYSNNPEDIQRALKVQHMAVALASDKSEHKHIYLDNLGTQFRSIFQQSWKLFDIEEAISAHQQALRVTPDNHAKKPNYLLNLANAYISQFTLTGETLSIEDAVSNLHQAISYISDDSPMKPIHLASLSEAHLRRFRLLKQKEDIDQALSGFQQAVWLCKSDSVDKPLYLEQLGGALMTQYEFTSSYSDISNAVSTYEQAVQLTSDKHPRKAQLLIDLGSAYQCQSDYFGVGGANMSMIEKAIAAHSLAFKLYPDDSHRAAFAHSLMCKYEYSKDPNDLEDAICVAKKTLDMTEETDPYRTICYSTLGNAYNLRYEVTEDLNDLKDAISVYEIVAKTVTTKPDVQLDCALRWARTACANVVFDQSAMMAYDFAIKLIPHIVWHGIPLAKRYERLKVIGDLANEAVFMAIGCKQYGLALQWLEQARAILWGQLLQLRVPSLELEAVEPELAREFKEVSKSLDAMSSSLVVDKSIHFGSDASFQRMTQRHHHLAREWENIIKKIQSIPQFQQFLQPHGMAELTSASQYGIVIVITVYQHQCHALIIKQNSQQPIDLPLPEFSHQQAIDMQQTLKRLLHDAGRVARGSSRSARLVSLQGSEFSLSTLLGKLWHCVANPILKFLSLPVSAFHKLCLKHS